MSRRQFICLLGGGTVAAATAALSGCMSSVFPAAAVEAWNGPVSSETEPRRWALAYAITAPNPHNRQPWLVDLREANVITVFTDPQRVLPETDPFGRQIMVGHGTFIELLVIALAEQALLAKVQLWPQGELPAQLKDWTSAMWQPVARITVQAGATKDALFAQILKRHTVKVNFDVAKLVAESSLQSILAAGGTSRMQCSGTVQEQRLVALRKLALNSAFVELRTPRTNLESIRLARVGPSEILEHRDGISINSPLVRALTAFGQFDRSVPTPPGSTAEKKFIERFDGTSKSAMGFVWITGGNTRAHQVEAGRMYVRLQLQATALGIGMHPLSQALQEFPEMRPYYEQAHQLIVGKGAPQSPADPTVQMLCRIGYTTEPTPATPRRAVDKFIIIT